MEIYKKNGFDGINVCIFLVSRDTKRAVLFFLFFQNWFHRISKGSSKIYRSMYQKGAIVGSCLEGTRIPWYSNWKLIFFLKCLTPWWVLIKTNIFWVEIIYYNRDTKNIFIWMNVNSFCCEMKLVKWILFVLFGVSECQNSK